MADNVIHLPTPKLVQGLGDPPEHPLDALYFAILREMKRCELGLYRDLMASAAQCVSTAKTVEQNVAPYFLPQGKP